MRKALIDKYVPPRWQRWSRVVLATAVIAVFIGYILFRLFARDLCVLKVARELQVQQAVAAELTASCARKREQVEALRTSIAAIEDRARGELGMAYPNEMLLRVAPAVVPGVAVKATERP